MTSHDDQVNRQFGPAASAYLTSAAHAQGTDLDKLSRIVQGKSATVLDLGCGAGHVSFAVAAGVNAVTACDLSDDMLAVVAGEAVKRGLGNIATRQGIAEALPFPDCSFDYVLTRFSAHHWNSLPQALAEMRRVLKDDGRVIVIDVVAPAAPLLDTHLQSIELLRDVSHVRNYSVAEWTRQLAAVRLAGRCQRTMEIAARIPGLGDAHQDPARAGRGHSRAVARRAAGSARLFAAAGGLFFQHRCCDV